MPPSFQEAGRTVVFRVDASSLIGTGHVMRCLTLADELAHRKVRSVFLCRPHEGDLRAEITQRGHGLVSLPPIQNSVVGEGHSAHEDWLGVDWRDDAADTLHVLSALGANPDWLIVDHYAIDSRWERTLKPFVGRIMVIDDLADREHVCDLLVDQNLCLRMDIRYDDLVPSTSKRLLGPRYALVRDEFRHERAQLHERSGAVHSVLVSFGGVDHANLTARTLMALKSLEEFNLSIDVVLGATNTHRAEIEAMCNGWRSAVVHIQTRHMAELMGRADLSIGAGGTTTWERAYLGLPSIVVVIAENQREVTESAAQCGICWNLGWHESVDTDQIAESVREACNNPQSMRKMSRQALAISAHEHQTGTGEIVSAMLERVRVFA